MWTVVGEEQRRDRHHAVAVDRLTGQRSHGGGEATRLGGLRVRPVAGAEGRRRSRQQLGRGREHFVHRVGDRGGAALEGAEGALDALDDLTHGRQVLEGGDAAEPSHAL